MSDKAGFTDIKDKLFAGPLATNFYNEKYYSLPLNTNTKVAIFNKDLLAEAGLSQPPKTFEELIQAAKIMKAKGKYGIAIGGSGTWGMLPYFWSLGGRITNDAYTKASGYLDGPESVAALTRIVDLYNEGLVAPTLVGGEPGTWEGIREPRYLMIDDGPWFYSILGKSVEEITTTAAFPSGPAGSISVVGGEDIVMFRNTKHPEEAWKFMHFMMTQAPQIIMAKSGLIPTNMEAANSEEVLAVSFIRPYIEQLQTARPRTPHPSWGKMDEVLGLAFEKAVRGVLSPQKALQEAAAQIDGFLR